MFMGPVPRIAKVTVVDEAGLEVEVCPATRGVLEHARRSDKTIHETRTAG
jgi:hypothetical protein